MQDGGWAESARAYIAFQDAGDENRTLLLDPVMLRLCGDVAGLRALDVGCGEGRFSRMLSERGACVTGIDFTEEMVRTGLRRDPGGTYVRGSAEAVPFAGASFDLVISYVMLIDVVGYRAAIAEMARMLRPGGHLVVANLGFVTASEGWLKDENNARLHHRVDRYADEFVQTYEWLGIKIENWHRPLAAYMCAYLASGLVLRDFEEPVPEDQSLRDEYAYEDWFRVPLFNVMRWQRG